ncbi:MAG: hypothetical protein Q8W45_11840 [Candidatus Palauibacterales bacterium]|nr:hypothetical protein [Candidatus Palauibacterales bacterium]
MLPARQEAISQALVGIDALRALDRDVLLRVGLSDGSVHEGSLVSATPNDLAIRMKGSRIVNFPAEEILSLALGRTRKLRKWTLIGLGVAGASGLAWLVNSLPILGSVHDQVKDVTFHAIFYASVGIAIVLLSTTRLRQWLTRWDVILEESA